MEATNNTVCPVCTLYLRPGITLKSHLASHPKQKVIEALVRLSYEDPQKQVVSAAVSPAQPSTSQTWSGPPITPVNVPQSTLPGNHSFIYQQFVSSTNPQNNVLNVNQLGQQYVTIPTVFNPQMMCQPYVYQQQQVIMSSGPQISNVPRILSIEENQASPGPHIIEEIDNEQQEPELVIIENNQEEMQEQEGAYNLGTGDLKDNENINMDFKEQIIKGDRVISFGETLEMIEVNTQNYDDQDRELGSPLSNASSDYIRVRKDLNKSCQTQCVADQECTENENEQKEFYTGIDEASPSYVTLTSSTQLESECAPNIERQAVTLIDMDGMNLMLNSNEFVPNQIIDEFDYNNRYERPRVLMNIGEYSGRELGDESVSVDSANIRADEHMPPRGELSGQESNASDMAWSKIQYNEGHSVASASYDLIARETWDGSDASDNEIPPLQSRDPAVCDETPTISGFSDPPIQYKCPTCGENFNCLKERRIHQSEKHQKNEPPKDLEIGARIGKRKVKKIIVKPKKEAVKSENNFDNVFKLKMEKFEAETERTTVILEPQSQQMVDENKVEEAVVSNPVVCTSCDAVLADNNALKQHREQVHNYSTEDRYKCNVCLKTFPCEPKYTEHLHIHPLECRLCAKYFYRRQNLQLHMKRHLGIRPYKCTACTKSFLTKQKLHEHKNIHTGETPFKCTMCDEKFKRHSNLVQHKNRHHYNLKRKTKDYICACGEVLHSKKKLAWHKEIHDNKPKACTQCSEKFIHSASLTRHMRRAHNERFVPKEARDNENVECPICKSVYLRSSLDVHIKTHSGNRPFTCLICNKDFTTKWNLKLHKWTHTARANKPYKCDLCKGAFIRESDYTAHMNSHKSIKPYTCNYCGAQFIRKYNCIRHVREHEKVKTYCCQVCGKSFHRSYYLKDHMRVHSGVRPFSCHICGKTSATKSNHNKHVRIHHAREPVSTEN